MESVSSKVATAVYCSLAIALLVLSACGVETTDQPKVNDKAKNKVVEGWENLTFGTSFDEAMALLPGFEWNSASISRCYEEIAIEGCHLFPDRERAIWPLKNGIMYLPSLEFNRAGELTSVSAEYQKKQSITLLQCRDILRRTIDGVVEEFGPLRWPAPKSEDRTASKIESTDQRNPYLIWYSKDGAFVSGPMRTHWDGASSDERRPILEWNKSAHVSVIASMIKADGKGYCRVSVRYVRAPTINT